MSALSRLPLFTTPRGRHAISAICDDDGIFGLGDDPDSFWATDKISGQSVHLVRLPTLMDEMTGGFMPPGRKNHNLSRVDKGIMHLPSTLYGSGYLLIHWSWPD